jgi:glycosyltransferase involved in cell wall biosynthesis
LVNAPRLLIVSAFFPPSRKIGARRPERFARHLARRGWDVTVLTLRERYADPLDDGWTPPEGVRIVRTHAFMPGDALRGAATALHRLGVRGGPKPIDLERAEDNVGVFPAAPTRAANGTARPVRDAFWRTVSRAEFPDRWIGWKPFALAATRGMRFDAVLATLPPYTPALIAHQIARRQGAAFALDYRDPWTEAPRIDWDPALYAHLLDRHRRVEDACLRDADLVLATSPTICRWLAARARTEPVFAPNSFDRVESSPRSRTSTLVYTGSLAYGRSLEPVLTAMARLSDDPAGRALELVYAGTDGGQVLAHAARLGLSARVRDVGYVTARESDALISSALAAVVLVTPRYEYMLPGKLFEVVASGTPLLLVAPADADVTTICREHALGWQHVPQDVDGIVASLRQALAGTIPVPAGLDALSTDHVVDTVDRGLRASLSRETRTAMEPKTT